MKSLPLVYNPNYVTALPADHRFPMPKFGKVYEWLVRDGVAALDQFHIPSPADETLLTLVHSSEYVRDYMQGMLDNKAMRRIGFPWSPELVKRTCTAVGGTVLTAQLALTHGLACNTAGGTHHAFPTFGSGYCIFNDMAVAGRFLREAGQAQRILFIDLDVHQGDGTAFIFAGDRDFFTFSMHCQKNFPFHKQRSTLDVGLPVQTDDATYLAQLQRHLPRILDDFRPDFAFYDGGVDPHRDDRLGKLALTDDGLFQRDRFVFVSCAEREIPVAAVIGGGYQADHDGLARRHTLLHAAASTVYAERFA